MKGRWKRFVNKAIYPVGMVSPLLTYIQAFEIWWTKDASGVSLLAWGGYIVVAFFWINYAAFNRVLPVLIVEFTAIFGYALIVIGTLIYG